MSTKWVIGDLHGGLKGLVQLLERAPVASDDQLIFLGDYVDGWSESAQLIDFLIQFQQQFNCIFIRGNHDVYCHNWLYKDELDSTWINHGGVATMKSYSNYTREQRLKHIDFYEQLHNFHIDEENRLFIHAGYTSMHGPEKETHESMLYWDRTLWEMALTMDQRIQKDSKLYPKRLLLFNEIYIGHTPTLQYDSSTPMQACNVWNIDTGAGFKGAATILNVTDKTCYQSDPLPELYPTEKGRNN